MIKPISTTNPLYPKLQYMVENRKIAAIEKNLNLLAEQGEVRKQFVLALSLQAIAEKRRGPSDHLSDTIIAQQSHKIDRFGDKAFPLSEKQVAVIAREICY